MRLKSIELTNFRQHRKLDVDFNGTMIAILGKNGSGKSNLIEAIQFVLTGELPGSSRSDLVTWGEKDGSVRLVFTAGAKHEQFTLIRKISGDVTLKVGCETIKQPRTVEAVLREKAWLNKELMQQIVFVSQKGVEAILFDGPKSGEIAFQRLIGIGNASKIHDALGKEISARDKSQMSDVAIGKARRRLAEQLRTAQVCRNVRHKYDLAVANLLGKETLGSEKETLGVLTSMKELCDAVTSACEAAENAVESTKMLIDDLIARKRQNDKFMEKMDTIRRVRDWFHYKEGPRIMSQNVKRDLSVCVNNFLGQFNAPFVVEAMEEDVGFRCRFIDGRTMPDLPPAVSMLSVGQKIMLSIAFRMAIYMCFGDKLGLLCLDEPTANLDDANIVHLSALMQKVGEVARNKGLQILMATHEKALMPCFDTKIDLGMVK